MALLVASSFSACKRDGKSKHYDDVSISYLFLAINLNHVGRLLVTRPPATNLLIRTFNLQYILGGDWVMRHEANISSWRATSYEQLSSAKVYALPPENPAAAMSPEWRKQCLWTSTWPSRKCAGSRCRRCQSLSFAKTSKVGLEKDCACFDSEWYAHRNNIKTKSTLKPNGSSKNKAKGYLWMKKNKNCFVFLLIR